MISLCILILFLIIIAFDYINKTTEHYTFSNPFGFSNQSIVNSEATAVNLRKPRNFGNFGIIGKFPANPICDSCHLEYNCTNYGYEVDEKNANVCRKCKINSINKNYNQMDQPLYVFSRSAGRPRQCRQIH